MPTRRINFELEFDPVGDDDVRRAIDGMGDEARQAEEDVEDLGEAGRDMGDSIEKGGAAGILAMQELQRHAEAAFQTFKRGAEIIVNSAVQSNAELDRLAKASRTLGLDATDLAQLEFAAKLQGGSVESLSTGLAILAQRAGDAAEGIAVSKDSFDALGVSVVDTDGNLRSLDDLFLDLADGIADLDNETQKIDLARTLFGRGGVELLLLLDQGREGIKALKEEAGKAGVGLFTEEELAQAEEFNDSIDTLNANLQSLLRDVLEPIQDDLIEIIKFLSDVVEGIREWVKENPAIVEFTDKIGLATIGFGLLATGALVAFTKIAGLITAAKAALVSLGVTAAETGAVVSAATGTAGTGVGVGLGVAAATATGVGIAAVGASAEIKGARRLRTIQEARAIFEQTGRLEDEQAFVEALERGVEETRGTSGFIEAFPLTEGLTEQRLATEEQVRIRRLRFEHRLESEQGQIERSQDIGGELGNVLRRLQPRQGAPLTLELKGSQAHITAQGEQAAQDAPF